MMPSTSQNKLCQFIGLVNYYRGIWARHSHSLAYLTKTTSSKVKFKWTKIKQEVFEDIKWVVACNVLLSDPYFDE